MKGIDIIRSLREFLNETDVIISSNGNISREVYHNLPQPQIYLRGSMGLPVPVGLGYALANPNRCVIVITGDGNFLMGLGSMVTAAFYKPENLKILILDNNSYFTTGGQDTVSATLDYPKFFESLKIENKSSKKAYPDQIQEELRIFLASRKFTVYHYLIDQSKEDLPNIPLHPEEITKLLVSR